MTSMNLLKISLVACCASLFGCERDVSFSRDVQPILTGSCLQCHDQAAEGESASGLALASYDDLMAGTRFGAVVVPGSPESSVLYQTIAGLTAPEIRMPPHHEESFAEGQGTPLTRAEIETIGAWIDQGALDN
jgi:hypothetical protein